MKNVVIKFFTAINFFNFGLLFERIKIFSKDSFIDIFEWGAQEGLTMPVWIFVGFQQRDGQASQSLNNNTFYRPPLTSAQCIIGTGKYPDSAILLTFADDDYSQGYGQTNEAFKALTKDDALQPYISDNDFRTSNDDDDIGYSFYAFDIRYQKNLESAQPL